MFVEVSRFSAAMLDDAVRLLVARRCLAVAAEPALTAEFAEASQVRADIESQLGVEGAGGVVALDSGRLAGFMLGNAAPSERGRVAEITGHAEVGGATEEVPRQLYAALAERWVAAGFFQHEAVETACDRAAADAWFGLGFGRWRCQAIRPTAEPLPYETPPGLHFREAGETDFEEVARLSLALQRHHTTAPMFNPQPPEAIESRRRQAVDLYADPRGHVWLAERDGEVVGIMAFCTPHPLVAAPERTIYLAWGYAVPGVRGGGAGRALLGRSLHWARDAGYDWCLLSFLSANIHGARFWPAHGFRPLAHGFSRTIDARIAWARS